MKPLPFGKRRKPLLSFCHLLDRLRRRPAGNLSQRSWRRSPFRLANERGVRQPQDAQEEPPVFEPSFRQLSFARVAVVAATKTPAHRSAVA